MPGTRPGMTNPKVVPWPHLSPSPPSPRNPFRSMPPIAGVKLATAAAGIKYLNRTDVLLALLAPGTTVGRRVHQIEMPVRAGGVVPRQSQARQGPRAGRQFRQRQRLHRQDRTAGLPDHAKIAARAIGCEPADIFLASTGVIGEPLNAAAFDGVMEGMVVARTRSRGSTPPRRS